MHGQTHSGDGFVGVTCEETSCRCEWSAPTQDAPLRAPFTIEALPSDAGACRRLLVERCMIGMRLDSRDAGVDSP